MLIDRNKNIILFAVIILIFINTAFGLNSGNNLCKKPPFKLKKAYYQSWIISNEEKGTDVILLLTNIEKGVTFDSIIFRGIKLEAFKTLMKKELQLKSILPGGKSRIKIDLDVVNLPDQLIYHHNGERKTFPLNSIVRQKTRYY